MLPFEIENRLGEIRAKVEAQGAELIEIVVRHASGRQVLAIIADKRGGISLEDCAAISRSLGDYFDEVQAEGAAGFFASSYFLEVSSPGLDRPLKTEKDFTRVVGETLRFVYRDPLGRVLDDEGHLDRVMDGVLCFSRLSRFRGGELFVRLDAMVKAKRQIKFKK
jgi:ribosome maturation factor RimP